MTDDDPEVRALLGLAPLPTRCPCGCGVRLLRAGTRIRNARLGRGRVATWAGQDHWTVPVTFDDGDGVMCLRTDTIPLEKS